MSSYLGPVPNIPTLAPVRIVPDDTQPIHQQLDNIYTDVAFNVNDKKRRDTYRQIEEVTIDLWVDDKPVFRKTIATGVITQGMTYNIAHGITGLADLVDIRVMLSDGTTRKLLPYAHPTAANAASVDVTATTVDITTGATFGAGSFEGYIIMQYTKA